MQNIDNLKNLKEYLKNLKEYSKNLKKYSKILKNIQKLFERYLFIFFLSPFSKMIYFFSFIFKDMFLYFIHFKRYLYN